MFIFLFKYNSCFYYRRNRYILSGRDSVIFLILDLPLKRVGNLLVLNKTGLEIP